MVGSKWATVSVLPWNASATDMYRRAVLSSQSNSALSRSTEAAVAEGELRFNEVGADADDLHAHRCFGALWS